MILSGSMKKIIFKNTIRTIIKTKSRFLSILFIVLIGVSFYSGIHMTSYIMKHSVDVYYKENNMMDYQIVSNYGLLKEDVKALERIKNLKVLPGYSVDTHIIKHKKHIPSKIISIDILKQQNVINQLSVVQGRLPQKLNEIVLLDSVLKDGSFHLEDYVYLPQDSFYETSYQVVGFVRSPEFISKVKGKNIDGLDIEVVGYIDAANFKSEVYHFINVTVEGSEQFNSFDTAYFNFLKPYTNQIKELGYKQAESRKEDIVVKANETLENAKKEYESQKNIYKEEIEKAKQKIEEAKREILLNESKVEAGKLVLESTTQASMLQIEFFEKQVLELQQQWNSYENNFKQQNNEVLKQKDRLHNENKQLTERLNELEPRHNEVQLKVDALRQEIDSIHTQMKDINQQLNDSSLTEEEKAALRLQLLDLNAELTAKSLELTTLQLDSNYLEYKQIQIQIQTNLQTIKLIDYGLKSAKETLEQLQVQLQTAKNKVEQAKEDLVIKKTQGEIELTSAKSSIEHAKKELSKAQAEVLKNELDGQEKLRDALDQITVAEEKIKAIEDVTWFVLDRGKQYSYKDYESATIRMEKIAMIFPVFFFLIAALVTLTTMTRLIEESRVEIGTLKSLGCGFSSIAFKYIFYGLSATCIGSIMGLIIGVFSIPSVIYHSWKLEYLLPSIKYMIDINIIFITVILSLTVILITILLSIYKELIEKPANLLRPKQGIKAKKILLEKIPLFWNPLSFISKVTIRNLIRYKKKVVMTIIGVSGCTALLVCGFGIKDSIRDITKLQFQDIYQYNGIVTLKNELTRSEKQKAADKIKSMQGVQDVTYISMFNGKINDENIDVIIGYDNHIEEFIHFRSRSTQQTIDSSEHGVILSEKLANKLNVKTQDTVILTNKDYIAKEFTVVGIAENYVGHFVYVNPQAYQEQYRTSIPYNTLLVKGQSEKMLDIVSAMPEVLYVNFYDQAIENFNNMIHSLNIVILILIVASAALAFVVMYNLTNVNIAERIREIATIKVLGFYNKEVYRYIFNENIILAFISSLIGIIVGSYLHQIIILTVELDQIMFGRKVAFMSYILSIILTIFFTFLINVVMKPRLRDIDMVESLKSVE